MRRSVILFIAVFFHFVASAEEVNWMYQFEYNTHGKNVQKAVYSPYRQWLALSLGDHVTLYDQLGNEIYKVNREYGYGDICFSPDERYLLLRNWRAHGDLAFLELNTLLIKTVVHKEEFLEAGEMHFVQDLNHILFSGKKGVSFFEIDDQANMRFIQSFHQNGKFDINGITVSDDGEKVFLYETGRISLSNNSKYDGFDAFLYEFKNGEYVFADSVDNDISYNDFHFIPGTKKVVVSTIKDYGENKRKELSLIDVSGGKLKTVFDLRVEHEFNYLGVSPDGSTLVTSGDGIQFYEIKPNTFQVQKERIWHYSRPYILEFSPDGKHLLTFQSDRGLVQWNIDGIDGDIRSQLYNVIGIDFSPAFKEVLSGNPNCFAALDKSLIAPKGEFEKSEQFEKRREKARYEVLDILQELLEKSHQKKDKGKSYLYPGYVLGYNADREVFKVKLLGEEVAVRVPLEEAPLFKERYSSFALGYSKRKNEVQTIYEDFYILDTKTRKEYKVFFKRNPFDFQSSKRRSETVSPLSGSLAFAGNESLIDNDTTGKTYALIITTNQYKEFGDLVNPILDGETIAKELKDHYEVITDVIQNPTLVELKMRLRDYAERGFNKNDQLMIFVAGHGHFDPIYKEGYLVAADSRLNDPTQVSYLSHSSLKTIVKNIPCKHILLVMDVCFGGTFDQNVATGHRGTDMYSNIEKDEFIERKLKFTTRLYITSGGNRYVPDGRPGQHSPFARNFLIALRTYGGEDGVLTTSEIMNHLEKSEIQPHFGEFSGNEPGSDFILVSE